MCIGFDCELILYVLVCFVFFFLEKKRCLDEGEYLIVGQRYYWFGFGIDLVKSFGNVIFLVGMFLESCNKVNIM